MENPLQQPVYLCVDNEQSGGSVTIELDPCYDMYTYSDKSRSLLNYNNLTSDSPEVGTSFIQDCSDNEPEHLISVTTGENNELVYILDDGTSVTANQIHLTDCPSPKFNMKTIPYVKYAEDTNSYDSYHSDIVDLPLRCFNILKSPSNTSSLENDFVKTLPFKSVKPMKRDNKSYFNTNKVDGLRKFKGGLTREDIINIMKESSAERRYEAKEKPRHIRKTAPMQAYRVATPVKVLTETEQLRRIDVSNCYLCKLYITNTIDRYYLLTKEENDLLSVGKLNTNTVKVLCEVCLNKNYNICKDIFDGSLSNDEFLVIQDGVKTVYMKSEPIITEIIDITTPDCSPKKEITELEIILDEAEYFGRNNIDVVKLDMDSEGDITAEQVNHIKPGEVALINVKEEIFLDSDEARSSDIDMFEDNDETADSPDAKENYGQLCDGLKCRFCDKVFTNLTEATLHSTEHRVPNEDVYPCVLCQYGYPKYAWLRGHVKKYHTAPAVKLEEDVKVDQLSGGEEQKPNSENVDECNASPSGGQVKSILKRTNDEKSSLMKKVKNLLDSVASPKKMGPEKNDSDEDAIFIVEADSENETRCDTDAKKRESQKKTNMCHNCGKLYMTAYSLKVHRCHQDRRGGRGAYTRCRDEDDEAHVTRRGRYRHQSPVILTCDDCNTTFTSKVRLKFHMNFHLNNMDPSKMDTFTCDKCEQISYTTESQLFDHVHFKHLKVNKWSCPVAGCSNTFYLKATLTKHCRTHTDTRRYKCMTCDKRFLDKQTLDEHGVTHLKKKPFECGICHKQLTRRSRLRMHLRAHEEELRPALVLVCIKCRRAFKDSHQAQEHASTSIDCMSLVKEEPKTSLSPTSGVLVEMSVEEDSASETKQLIDSLFEPRDKFLSEQMLMGIDDKALSIISVVEIDKVFRCEFCEEVFYWEDALNDHRRIHKNKKNPFTCHICKVKFATYSRCTTHKTTHGYYKKAIRTDKSNLKKSDVEEGPNAAGIVGYGDFPVVKHFLCEECGRSYLHWTYLQVHRRMKHPVNKYEYLCDQCDARFNNSWSLSYHKKKFHNIHPKDKAKLTSVEQQVSCRNCNDVFSNKPALYKHRRAMHPELLSSTAALKPGIFGCAMCLKRYSSKTALQTHTRQHDVLNTRPFMCMRCKLTHPTILALQLHIKTEHSDEYELSCHSCYMVFTSRVALHKHMSSEHNDSQHQGTGNATGSGTLREYSCEKCDSKFYLKSKLRAHMKDEHGDQILVFEVPGLEPDTSAIMDQLNANNIIPKDVVEIAKISVPKDSMATIPLAKQELNKILEQLKPEQTEWSVRTMTALNQIVTREQEGMKDDEDEDEDEADSQTDWGSVCEQQQQPRIFSIQQRQHHLQSQSATITNEDLEQLLANNNIQLLPNNMDYIINTRTLPSHSKPDPVDSYFNTPYETDPYKIYCHAQTNEKTLANPYFRALNYENYSLPHENYTTRQVDDYFNVRRQRVSKPHYSERKLKKNKYKMHYKNYMRNYSEYGYYKRKFRGDWSSEGYDLPRQGLNDDKTKKHAPVVVQMIAP